MTLVDDLGGMLGLRPIRKRKKKTEKRKSTRKSGRRKRRKPLD